MGSSFAVFLNKRDDVTSARLTAGEIVSSPKREKMLTFVIAIVLNQPNSIVMEKFWKFQNNKQHKSSLNNAHNCRVLLFFINKPNYLKK